MFRFAYLSIILPMRYYTVIGFTAIYAEPNNADCNLNCNNDTYIFIDAAFADHLHQVIRKA